MTEVELRAHRLILFTVAALVAGLLAMPTAAVVQILVREYLNEKDAA